MLKWDFWVYDGGYNWVNNNCFVEGSEFCGEK